MAEFQDVVKAYKWLCDEFASCINCPLYNMDFNRNMKKKNKLKRKATNSLKQVVYMAIWNEEIPKKCKKVKCYEN